MKIRNGHAGEISQAKIAGKYGSGIIGPVQKFLLPVVIILLIGVLSACLWIRSDKVEVSLDDEYRVVHLFGTGFFFHKTETGIQRLDLVDIEKGNASKINTVNSCQKKYAAVIYTKGVKLYDHGKYVSGYQDTGGLEVLSSFFSDYDGNGNDDLFLLFRKEGKKYGEKLIILNFNRGMVRKTYEESFQKLNPWKVQVCDVDGDGQKEVSLGVYTMAKYHRVYAKRPFLYYFHKNKLYPKWLGSRLSQPFDDYIFCDVDGNKMDELISIETMRDGKKELDAYQWKGFGFESIGVSEEYAQMGGLKANGKAVTVVCGDKKTARRKAFEYHNGKLKTRR